MSACQPIDRLMQTLRVHVPGAPDATLELELFNAMDKLFRRTNAWRYEDDVTLDSSTTDYALSLPEGTMMVRELSVTLNDMPVTPTSYATAVASSLGRVDASTVFADGDAEFDPMKSDLSANLFTYAIYQPNYVTVTKPPDATQVQYPLVVTMALTLQPDCLECDCGDWPLPDWMFDTYFEDFLDGTYASMFAMLAKPWANKDLAMLHGRRFRNRMAFRKQEAVRGFAHDTPTWRFPRGWV
jgi:hypothetical protein